MKNIVKLLVLVLFPLLLPAQVIEWEDVSSNYEFPEGVRLFHGTKTGNTSFLSYYYEVDMNVPGIGIRPYISTTVKQVNDFSTDVGAYGAINGGFFAGGSSVSSVVFPGSVEARNVTALSRNVGGVTKSYPVIRPILAVNKDRTLATEWVYHHSTSFADIFKYNEPLNYTCDDPTPLPVPLKANGSQYEDIAYGLGGGPMLIKDGIVNITYCEEIFWGSGVYLTDVRPRTAVGFTATNKAIMFVTNEMTIENMAEILLELDCIGAMNLDGGGSTAMSAGGQSIYNQGRAVPTILAIVHSDSLNIPKVPTFEKFIDTGDAGVTSNGSWFASANDGYFVTPSQLHALATDAVFYDFPLNLPAAGEYEIYGWWTSHSNRAGNTPFYVTHASGTDKVLVNQSIGGSMWNLIGKFSFNGTQDESVRITAAATINQFVVADAVRVVSYEVQQAVNTIQIINGVEDVTVAFGTAKEDALAMLGAETTIQDSEGTFHIVALTWESEGYLSDTAGDYAATAVFELPVGVEQTNPPTDLEVTATITVLELDDTSLHNFISLKFSIYPNPGKGVFTVKGNIPGKYQVEIIGLDGKKWFETSLKGTTGESLDVSFLSKGIYLFRVRGVGFNSVQKLVIQ